MRSEALQSGASMEHGTIVPEPNMTGSFSQTCSATSSLRRRSLSLNTASQINDDIESENVSEAGDIGDRALPCNRRGESGRMRLSVDSALESGLVFPHDSTAMNEQSLVSPLPEEIMSPLSTDAAVHFEEKKQDKERALVLSPLLDYISCLVYLAVFGILGVLTRYLLQKLFGPGIAGVTSDHSILYLDLPSNMVGSFFMGWFGVVFKRDISRVSDHLAIGLTTGYLGSLTTFSGWNQKMLELVVDGDWVSSLFGFLLGLLVAASSIRLGVGTAKCVKLLFKGLNKRTSGNWSVDSFNRHLVVMAVLLLMLGLLWSVSGTLLKKEFQNHSSGSQLWLACIVAAPGVWIRWRLARLNGRGLGKAGFLNWLPFGTLLANVSAACIMAALATLKKAVQTKTCDTISAGIQFGFLGCLSTVSTFIAEYNAMEESNESWRAYAYALITIVVSFVLGILIYSVPVWTRGYD